jgi:hypothetical protein
MHPGIPLISSSIPSCPFPLVFVSRKKSLPFNFGFSRFRNRPLSMGDLRYYLDIDSRARVVIEWIL